jgi:hypothetical protein
LPIHSIEVSDGSNGGNRNGCQACNNRDALGKTNHDAFLVLNVAVILSWSIQLCPVGQCPALIDTRCLSEGLLLTILTGWDC